LDGTQTQKKKQKPMKSKIQTQIQNPVFQIQNSVEFSIKKIQKKSDFGFGFGFFFSLDLGIFGLLDFFGVWIFGFFFWVLGYPSKSNPKTQFFFGPNLCLQSRFIYL
jgi:hypothetical protein